MRLTLSTADVDPGRKKMPILALATGKTSSVISQLNLVHFKNHSRRTFVLDPGLNFILGRNGIGKTNLLEAIYYLCMARGHSTPQDKDTVQFGQPFFRLEANADPGDGIRRVEIKVKPGEIKEISVDGKVSARLSDYVGFLPVVILTPEDVNLIQGGSSARRRFLDLMICQSDRHYLEYLQRYQKILSQRNALLRRDGYQADRVLLMTYSQAMQEPAAYIYAHRERFVSQLEPFVSAYYATLSDSRETPRLEYHSQLADSPLLALAEKTLESDVHTGFTTKGIHKDDLSLSLDEKPAKRFGSQGQVKSLLIAIHLAEATFLRTLTAKSPILLLDDIFDRLDDIRARRLMEILASFSDSQVVITDPSPEHIRSLVVRAGLDAHFIELQDPPGGIRPENDNLHHHDDEEE